MRRRSRYAEAWKPGDKRAGKRKPAPSEKNIQAVYGKSYSIKRGEIRKQAKTLISSRFKDSGQTGYK